MKRDTPYQIFLHWLWSSSLVVILLLFAWDLGVLARILGSDATRISHLILLVFSGSVIHAGWLSWRLSLHWRSLTGDPSHPGIPGNRSFVAHCVNYLESAKSNDGVAAEVLAERLRGGHQVGWFIAGVLVKLGLLGTVIGFVMMLRSVSGLEQLDTSDIKALMQQMTLGMGVAMNTTLVGLSCSIVLGGQYLMLDRSADRLIADTVDAAAKVAD